jgi:mannonate dehydratase
MKLGIGLYRHMLSADHYAFAKQCGCSHVVIHYCDYFNDKNSSHAEDHFDQPTDSLHGWGYAGNPDKIWTAEELTAIREEINSFGLEVAAVENFDPAHWHDVLLDGPEKVEQIEKLKAIIRNVGKAGIPCIGYNFSLAGVTSRIKGKFARGNAISVGMDRVDQTPLPNGMVWNMIYNVNPPEGTVPSISHEELWNRLQYFLDELLPVAEEAGVVLAAHPDDPPVETLRGTPRLVYQPWMYQKLLNMHKSKNNQLELCIGSLAEMTEGDVYDSIDQYSKQKKIGYVHFRNVKGKVPNYKETFVDDGDVDMIRILQILQKNEFDGVLIPDHTPQMNCPAPWHAGMAFALGYMRAALQSLEKFSHQEIKTLNSSEENR